MIVKVILPAFNPDVHINVVRILSDHRVQHYFTQALLAFLGFLLIYLLVVSSSPSVSARESKHTSHSRPWASPHSQLIIKEQISAAKVFFIQRKLHWYLSLVSLSINKSQTGVFWWSYMVSGMGNQNTTHRHLVLLSVGYSNVLLCFSCLPLRC